MKERDWLVFLILGVLILGFAFYNAVSLPARSASGQWDWLTQDPEVIDFIGFNFRMQGVWQVGFAALVLAVAAGGYRQRQRWAWYAMWAVPVVILLAGVLMPWTLPILVVLFAAAVGALVLSRPAFFPSSA